MEGTVRAGETFSWDRETTEEQARVMRFPQPPGRTFVAVGSGGGRLPPPGARIRGIARHAPGTPGTPGAPCAPDRAGPDSEALS